MLYFIEVRFLKFFNDLKYLSVTKEMSIPKRKLYNNQNFCQYLSKCALKHFLNNN